MTMTNDVNRALIYGRIFVLLIPDQSEGGSMPTCIAADRIHPRIPAHLVASAAIRAHHGSEAMVPSFVGVVPDGQRFAALFAARLPAGE
ncbi:hypothetical protein F4553_005241 [Allocatelliglobosispora scoriae]|uniref:Uncharacterized protein n=1 Tax=Allocatelliglobosispora scoriae TaxID=643052 RepID=A0A841BYI8_9ACTN|nr:hypothetical protein [Allocatelliglobosispora scoriae]MBB5871862.1 hypothetical protein [Allocatelliglobosispora scoriae]